MKNKQRSISRQCLICQNLMSWKEYGQELFDCMVAEMRDDKPFPQKRKCQHKIKKKGE